MRVAELLSRLSRCNTWKTDLTPMIALARKLGNPQDKLKFIHVGGTNGKGSTCAMTAKILEEAGYRVGRFVSPYILEFRERIQINGEMIPESDLCRIGQRVLTAVEELEQDNLRPTEFDVVTMMGLIWFLEQRCDIVVLEVGVGGKIDSTNIVPPKSVECTAITSIGLDHTAILGDTLEQIAAEKSGILKEGVPVTVGASVAGEALSVIRQTAAEHRCPMITVSKDDIALQECVPGGLTFSYKGNSHVVRLTGLYQMENTSLVLELIGLLRQKGWHIPEEAVTAGLANVSFPARMERLHDGPLVLLDGAHNPEGATALSQSLAALSLGEKTICINGMMGDKDVDRVLDILAPLFSHVITLRPNHPRAMTAEELAQRWQSRGVPSESAESPSAAITRAVELAGDSGAVICCGSLFLCAEMRPAVQQFFQKE